MRPILSRPVCLALFSAVLVFLAVSSPLKADPVTVFSNFGSPGQTYDTGGYGFNAIASPFVASETATLTDAMLALFGNDSVTVYVESDSGGEPGTILDTLTTAGSIGRPPSILTYTCSSCSQLVGGTEYFLVAQQTVRGDSGWNLSNSDTGTFYENYTSNSPTGPWDSVTDLPLPAYEVDGTAVPEPSSLVLLGTGLLGLLASAARSKRLTPSASC